MIGWHLKGSTPKLRQALKCRQRSRQLGGGIRDDGGGGGGGGGGRGNGGDGGAVVSAFTCINAAPTTTNAT